MKLVKIDIETLKNEMDKKNITERGLSQKTGISESDLHKMFDDTYQNKIKLTNLITLGWALNVNYKRLLD